MAPGAPGAAAVLDGGPAVVVAEGAADGGAAVEATGGVVAIDADAPPLEHAAVTSAAAATMTATARRGMARIVWAARLRRSSRSGRVLPPGDPCGRWRRRARARGR